MTKNKDELIKAIDEEIAKLWSLHRDTHNHVTKLLTSGRIRGIEWVRDLIEEV